MEDKRLNDLLRWSIENSDASRSDTTTPPPTTNLTPEVMAALMGGPSDAELMRVAMEVVGAPDVALSEKLVAFDNLEQLIESLDNANNLAALDLWSPLLDQLRSPERDLRRMAAWCIGTAVQNNARTQERLLAVGGLPELVALALAPDEAEHIRRKAIYALSSACRNYQPAMDACADELTRADQPTAKIDATDMEAVDGVMNALRERAKAA